MEWISVKDRLPELTKSDNHPIEPMLESDLVLIWHDGAFNLSRFFKIGSHKTICFCKATHWMPLPQPPESV